MKQRKSQRNVRSLFDPAIIRPAIWDAFRKLDLIPAALSSDSVGLCK